MILQGEFERSQGIRYEFDRFLHHIGEGGMGVVYKGVMIDDNTNAILRDVAIKEVKAEGSQDEVDAIIQKAYREASIRLHNDNLVEMLGFIEVVETKLKFTKKKYFIISEFLTGVTLTDVLEGNYLDYKGDVVDYARQLGEDLKTDRDHTAYYIIKNILYGITALHDNGYIHRDIDPSNIMITDDGRIKLIDFGIAKKLNDLNAQDEVRCDGAFVGKVEYASPEMIDGNIHDQDFTTDIYGIGVLFYKLLTGRLPFDGNRFEILNSHLKKGVNTRVITNKKFADIIETAMRKKRKQRFQTSSEMRVALDQPVPPPYYKWIWLPVASVITVIAAFVFWPETEDEPGPDPVVPTPFVDPDPVPPPIVIDFTALNKDELWKALDTSVNNPEILFAIAKKYKDSKYDANAKLFWDKHLIPEGYAERSIKVPSKRTISSERFVFLTMTKAMDHATDPKLKEDISTGIAESIERFPDIFQYIPNTD